MHDEYLEEACYIFIYFLLSLKMKKVPASKGTTLKDQSMNLTSKFKDIALERSNL